jgi:hypothetical protein
MGSGKYIKQIAKNSPTFLEELKKWWIEKE